MHLPIRKYMRGRVSPWLILVAVALIWRLVYAYWTPIYQQYLVPPGDDAVFHITVINDILQGQISLFTGTYPHGFHLVAAFLAKIFGLNGLEAAIWIAPLLIIAPVAVIYNVGSGLFKSDIAGAFAAAVWAFMALGPVRAFGDGNYANLLASSTLLPLAILYIYRSVQMPRKKNILIAFLSIIAVALTHHLTLIYLVVVITPWISVIVIERLRTMRNREQSSRKTKRIILLAVIAILLLIILYRPMLGPYLVALFRGQSLVQAFGADNKPLDLIRLLEINNPSIIVGGLLGLLVVMSAKLDRHIKLLMSGWVLVLIILAVAPGSVLQGRFARELAIPCSLVIGFAASQFVHFAHVHKARAGAVFIICAILFADVLGSFSRAFALPDPFFPLMRVQHDEEAAYPMLNSLTPPGTVILSANSNPFLPFLVNHAVVVPSVPGDVVDILRQSISIVYVGAKPALSDGYPYYQGYDSVSAAIKAIPGLTVIATLSNGSTIYRLNR